MPSIKVDEASRSARLSPEGLLLSAIHAVAENAELVWGRTNGPSAGSTVSRSVALYTTNNVPAVTFDHWPTLANVIVPLLLSASVQPRASEFFRNRISTHSFEPLVP